MCDKEFVLYMYFEYEFVVEVLWFVGRFLLVIGMIVGYVKVFRVSLDMFLDIWEE